MTCEVFRDRIQPLLDAVAGDDQVEVTCSEASRNGIDESRLVGIDQVDEVVGRRGALLGRRLGSADVHPAVHLGRIDRDDLQRESRGELQRDARLAGSRGADERERLVLVT